MKKIILFMAIGALMTNMSYSQEKTTETINPFKFGLKAGLNYSNVYNTSGEEFVADPKFGLAAGGFLAIPIGAYLGVQPEILFSQKGFKGSGKILGSTYKFTRTTNFIDVPLFISFRPSEYFSLLVGPQYSYLIKQKDVFETGGSSIEQEQEFKNDNIRRNILCFAAGADFTLKQLVLSARVGWDITKNNGDGTSTTPRYKNMWYQATIGFRL